MSNLPEPIKDRSRDLVVNPSMLRAAVSPTAVAVVVVGVGIGLLAHSVVLAVVLAVIGYAIRMGAAGVAKYRRDQAAKPRPAQLDPWSVPEPWRQLVQQAATSQTRFDQAVDGWPAGPIRDRLEGMRPRLYAEMEALGAMARRGAAMTGWTGATSASATADELSEQLRKAEAERVRLGGSSPEREAQLSRTEEAVAAQLRALRSSEQASTLVHDRLRNAVARLDETVTTVLSMEPDSVQLGSAETVDGALQDLGDEMTALHAGLSEVGGTPPDSLKP